MWFTCLFILLLIMAATYWKAGPYCAVRVTVLLSLLVPSWVTYELFDFPVSVQIAVAIAALGAYCLHPQAIFRTRLWLVDWAMICLILTHIGVDWGYQGFSWAVPLRAYGEWFVPYVAGRLAIQKADDLRSVLPLMVAIVIVFAVISTVQGFTGVNLAETVFGHGQVDKNVHNMSRWGFHRAFGPLKNPNYFGVLQLLLFPWTIYAAVRALRHTGPWWWAGLPALSAMGVFFPMSRASQGGIVLSSLIAWLLTLRRFRIAIPLLCAVIVACIAWNSDWTIRLLDAWSGDLMAWSGKPQSKRPTIKIGDAQYTASSTSLHLHVVDLYGVAMRKAGLFGFGTEAITGFPVNVPVGQQDLYTLKRIGTVDNAFLLMGLRFGYVGLSCFFVWCAGVAAIWIRITLSSSTTPGLKAFSAAMAGVSITMLAILLTVWMPHDFGFWYIWIAGASSGLNAGLSRSQSSRMITVRDGGTSHA